MELQIDEENPLSRRYRLPKLKVFEDDECQVPKPWSPGLLNQDLEIKIFESPNNKNDENLDN